MRYFAFTALLIIAGCTQAISDNTKPAAPIPATPAAAAPAPTLPTYYVSPTGDDAKDGSTPETAWKTVAKVNSAPLKPGDQVLFARGGEWRESLVPSSDGAAGNPIIYAAYGNGPKPKFWGSDILPNADFQPVDGSTYKCPLKHPATQMMGVAVDHQLLAWTVKFSNNPADMIAAVEKTPGGYWVDANALYINTGGSDPRTDGKLYTLCSRQNIIQNAHKSHLIFRDLVVDESARLNSGAAFRVFGGSDVRLENCDAYRAGVYHYVIVNCDGFVGDHLQSAYVIPRQNGHENSSYLIRIDGPQSMQLLDCSAQHLQTYPGGEDFYFLTCGGSGKGNLLIKNPTEGVDGGKGFLIGTGSAVTILGGTFPNSHGVIYSGHVLLDSVTFTGNSCVDVFGADNIIQNCRFLNIAHKRGGYTGYSCAVIFRDKSRRNTLRFSTIAAAPGSHKSTSLVLGGRGTLSQCYANIMTAKPPFLGPGGPPDGQDLTADYNLYSPDAVFTEAKLSLADWQAAGLDQHSLAADPMFTDPAAGDFSPKPGSPAIAAAKIDPASRPAADAQGNPRPPGDCAIGACEPLSPRR